MSDIYTASLFASRSYMLHAYTGEPFLSGQSALYIYIIEKSVTMLIQYAEVADLKIQVVYVVTICSSVQLEGKAWIVHKKPCYQVVVIFSRINKPVNQ